MTTTVLMATGIYTRQYTEEQEDADKGKHNLRAEYQDAGEAEEWNMSMGYR
jgi:hypothetical protein